VLLLFAGHGALRLVVVHALFAVLGALFAQEQSFAGDRHVLGIALNGDEVSFELVAGDRGRAAPHERIEDRVAFF
jgi:hypothetical protein